MADRYWVGGTGTWNTTSTTVWSATSGGAGGASVPTVADNVFFDQAGTYTVTMTGALACLNITVSAGTVTFATGTSPTLNVRGSMSLVAGTVWNAIGTITFTATTAGQTITTNGVSFNLGPSATITFNGSGGVWTLGSALTTTGGIIVTLGTLNTSASNYSITALSITVGNSASAILTLNGSTLTLSNTAAFTANTSSVINAGTSTINCTTAIGGGFSGAGKTYYNVSFTGAPSSNQTLTIVGANTFNNLSFTPPSADAIVDVSFIDNMRINGSFTGSGSQVNRRIFYRSSVIGTARTLTLAGGAATISNADFRDITAATNGITATTGGGDCGGNTNITFPAAKTVYWNLAGAQNWSATGWAATSGGAPALANFPLAQDTAVFDNTGIVTGTITLNSTWNIGSLDMSARTTPMTLSLGTSVVIYGSWSNGTGVTLSGTQTLTFAGRSVQTVLGNGVTFPANITMDGPGGTFFLGSAVTLPNTRTFTLNRGTIGLSSYSLTTGLFASNNSNSRAIQFDTGSITVNGLGGTLWDTGTVNGLVVGGTRIVNVSYLFSAPVFVQPGSPTEANSISFNFTTGSYSLTLLSGIVHSLNFTGFSGSLNNVARLIYGDLTLSPTMTLTAGTNNQTFASTSATPRNITSNGKLMDFPVTFSGAGGSWVLQDAMTVGSTRTTTLTTGTLNLNGKTLTTGIFNSSGSATRSIAFGTGNITVNGAGGTPWTTSTTTGLTTSGTQVVNVSYSGSAATTVTPGSLDEVNSISFNFTTGLYTLGWTGSYRNVNFTGFSGTASSTSPRTIYGDLTLSSTMSYSSGTQALSFAATSGTKNITTNGVSIGQPISFVGVGGTWQLQDALTLVVGSGRGITSSAGTFNTNGYAVSADFLALGFTSSPRTINLGTSTVTLTGTSIPLNLINSIIWQYLTLSASSSTINFTNAGTKTALVADKTWGTLNQAGAGALTIDHGGATGTPTIGNLTNTVQPTSVLFVAGNTYNFLDFSLSGTAGNLVTISSATTAQHTLSKASGIVDVSYCNISYSNATGGATWNAFT